jgi:hypothetical protein
MERKRAEGGIMGKNPVQAIEDWFGERTALRRAFGSPGLTQAVHFCDLLMLEFEAEAYRLAVALGEVDRRAGEPRPVLWYPEEEMRADMALAKRYAKAFELAKLNLTDGSAGEMGWDTVQSIAAAEAVTPKTTVKADAAQGGRRDVG